ncbi:pectin degradation protein [Natrinema versiforme JCM 10478]|uniref:Pectin degradation protein n=2 Tax=Natrinema versiforme TaxID=88724 RepID=L9Y2V4_9EURY|nr:pectin degradation protein [Natrinema versiforme JCM 10478]
MGITEWDDSERIDGFEGGQRRVLAATDDLMLVHYALEPCRVIDAFTPPLEAYTE